MAEHFHISPVEQKKLDPEDRIDLLSWHREKLRWEAENDKEQKRISKRKKGSRLQALEDKTRREAGVI